MILLCLSDLLIHETLQAVLSAHSDYPIAVQEPCTTKYSLPFVARVIWGKKLSSLLIFS